MRGDAAVLMICALSACARSGDRAAAPASGAGILTPRPMPISVAVARLRAPGAPAVTSVQRRKIAAVLGATPAAKRGTLIVSLPQPNAGGADAAVLFYGDPRFPDGVLPPGEGTSSAHANGAPVPVQVAYHVIGGGCNDYYRPSSGEEFAVPGDGAGCATWRPSAADRAAHRFAMMTTR